jgi:hypothetical protein
VGCLVQNKKKTQPFVLFLVQDLKICRKNVISTPPRTLSYAAVPLLCSHNFFFFILTCVKSVNRLDDIPKFLFGTSGRYGMLVTEL